MTGGVNQPHHQKFAFVLLEPNNSASATTEKARKKLVRSHARKAGNEKKAAAARANARNEEIPDHQPPPLSEAIGRFRLSRPTPIQKKLLKAPIRGSHQEKASSLEEDNTSILPSIGTGLIDPEPPRQEDLQIFRDSGLVDPFDSLPIPLGPKQKTLLDFYSTNLTQNFISFDPQKDLIIQANSDPAWLNATFSLVALHHDLRTGRGLSPECLYHRGEALRLINERLSTTSPTTISESTIGAVASLVNFDITIGSTAHATMHMNGLQHILNLQGGLPKLHHNRTLQSLISWSDLLYSSACESAPRFQFACHSTAPLSNTAVCVLDLEIYESHLSHSPGFNVKMRETVRILRFLSGKKDVVLLASGKTDSLAIQTARAEFSNCVYLAEYRLLTLFEDVPENHESRIMRKPWQLGVYLYVHLALRELPGVLPVEQNLLKRLKGALEASSDLFGIWTGNLKLLLWIVFVGAAASADGRVERGFFVRLLGLLRVQIGIRSLVEFVDVLRSVLWFEAFYRPHAVALWGEVDIEVTREEASV